MINQQFIQAVNQLKSIKNPRQAAMSVLKQSAKSGNVMAKSLLENINSGNTSNVENILNNFLKEQNMDISQLKSLF